MIFYSRRIAGLAALLCFFASAPALAQKPPAAPADPKAAAGVPSKPAKPAKAGGASPVLPGGNSKDPISIDADKLEYFDKEQRAIYTGNVVVVQGESSLQCTVLELVLTKSAAPARAASPTPGSAKGAPAAAPGAGGGTEVRRMEAAGPVTVIQKDQVGTGDSGIYDKTENKVYLIGKVTLSQGPNVTKGDKLTYDMDKGTALVESGATEPRVKGLFVPGSNAGDPNAPPKKLKGESKPAPKP